MGQESWYLFLDNFKRCLQGTKRFGNSRNHSQTFSDSFGAMCLHPWVQCKFTHGCYVYAPISKWCCPCSILSKKCYHQKEKWKNFSRCYLWSSSNVFKDRNRHTQISSLKKNVWRAWLYNILGLALLKDHSVCVKISTPLISTAHSPYTFCIPLYIIILSRG